MINPNPTNIPEPLWWLWVERPNKAWRLSGILANKKGYHNTVKANKAHWPDNYSIRFPLDNTPAANFNFARGIDLTMSNKEMIKWTTRMRNSALDPRDNRLGAVREFYGTLDGKTVYGLIKDDEDGPWREATADLSHLWHGHMGVFTAYVNSWPVLKPILSVWAGESFEDWNEMSFLPKQGDEGQIVSFWQRVHNGVRNEYPGLPELKVDGDWGKATTEAVHAFWGKVGGKGSYKGDYMDNWVAYQYLLNWIKRLDKLNPDAVPTPLPIQVDPEVLQQLVIEQVNEYMDNWTRNGIDFKGTGAGGL